MLLKKPLRVIKCELLKKLYKLVSFFYRKYILRDKFLWEVEKWHKANGDKELRIENLHLQSNSLVFDVGGYNGEYAYKDIVYPVIVFAYE